MPLPWQPGDPLPEGEKAAYRTGNTRRSAAARLIEAVQQLDDSGAHTADRYDWQAAMAAADGLALYFEGMDTTGRLRPDCHDKIVCEWHEDWVVYRGDSVELVSGKHRDPGTGAYTTVAKLTREGGLAHLFNRWAALYETASCRLVTSGGLSSGAPQDLLAAAQHFRSKRSAGQTVVVTDAHAPIVTQLRKAVETSCNDTKQRWQHRQRSDLLARSRAVVFLDERFEGMV